jgi:predicted regulator of Ras-like GTPase activity (Roadblock/LC7/MglB family)
MSDSSNINGNEQLMDDPSSQLFANLADFYRENGLVTEAVAICQSGLESQPDNLQARLVLARCQLLLKEYDKARAEAVKVLSVQSENAEAKRVLAEADSSLKSDKNRGLEVKTETAPAEPESPAGQEPRPPQPMTHVITEEPKEEVGQPLSLPAKGSQEVMASSPLPLLSEASAGVSFPIKTAPQEPELQPDGGETKPIKQIAATLPAVLPLADTPASVRTQEQTATAGAQRQTPYWKALADLSQTHQVKACLLVDDSGYVVDESYSGSPDVSGDAEISAALTANVFKAAIQAIAKIKLGELERIVIETDREKIFLRQAGRMMLMISAEPAAKVGLVMVNSKRAVEQIESISMKNAR